MRKIITAFAMAGILVVAGCAPAGPTISQAQAQKLVLEAETAYELPLRALVAYNALPRCPGAKLCSDQATVEKLRTLNHAVIAALAEAAKIANAPNPSKDAITLALQTVSNASAAVVATLPTR